MSGKQLVFLFMSAVVVMVVVFLLGVNVGRGVRSAVGEPEVLAQGDPAAAPKGPDNAPPSGEPAKPAQPELSYHDLLLQATPAPDKAAADKTPPSEAPPPVAEAPPPTQSPVAAPVPNPPAETRSSVAQTAPAQPAAAAPKPNGTGWFLQTGAYSTQAVADGQVAKLKQLNFPAFVLPLDRSGTRLFHVRVGPFADRAEAGRASSRLTRQGFTPSITR